MSEDPPRRETLHWRSNPCAQCSGGTTVLDFLIGRLDAGEDLSGASPDEIVERLIVLERQYLLDWVSLCPHTQEESASLVRLDEGSEHIVYLPAGGEWVIKVTKPGIFGDNYFLENDRVYQRCATPAEYFLRLAFIKSTFDFAPEAIAVTPAGQIMTRQKFVKGMPPSQEEVDAFLESVGIEPIKRSCWLWKKPDPEAGFDYWVGDARADNFVKTPTGIVPIDLRMWGVARPDEEA